MLQSYVKVTVLSSSLFAACVDGCVDVLLDEVEEMIDEVTSVDMSSIIPAPWPSLRKVQITLFCSFIFPLDMYFYFTLK